MTLKNRKMLYILKKNLRQFKKIRHEIQQIKGFGPFITNQLCDRLGINPLLTVRKLRFPQKKRLLEKVKKHYIYGSRLHRLVSKDIKRLIVICSFKGFRHQNRLPVRGQRTHTNASTVKKILYYKKISVIPRTRA